MPQLAGPGTKSIIIWVPDSVPSVLQSSRPNPGEKAIKNNVPFTSVRVDGDEGFGPGLISLTSLVPCEVPSVTQSSSSPCGSSPSKKTNPFDSVSQMQPPRSRIFTVPFVVPSLFQRSKPGIV